MNKCSGATISPPCTGTPMTCSTLVSLSPRCSVMKVESNSIEDHGAAKPSSQYVGMVAKYMRSVHGSRPTSSCCSSG